MPVTRNQANAANNAKSDALAADGAAPRESSDRGETSTETEPFRQDSPENCSICLGPFSNKSFTSSCAHSFCFVCLKQWSKVKAECPLCKQPFTSIFHNIRSNDSYDIYELPPQNPPRQFDYLNFYNYMGGNLPAFTAANPYYILSRPSLDADLTLSNFSRFQFRHRRYDRYLNPQHPVHGEHQYSYSSSAFNPSSHVSAASWPRGAEDFRLRVYRHHMGPPAVILGCESSTYRLTPAMVAASGHRLQRIMPWLARELFVLLRSHQNVRLAVNMIQPLLTEVTIDSPFFSERVSPLIGQRARQFIQEFSAFANSALTMQAFDRKAMYRRREARFLYEDDTSSSSSDDDDVVEVTNISSDMQATHTVSSASNATSSLRIAGWDSPTPGPSWESMDTQNAGHQLENDMVSISSESDEGFRPDLNDSDSDNSNAGSDIVFVKYDKPWNERSPIQLSSDSEGDGHSKKKKKVKHKKKQKEASDTPAGSSKKGKGHKLSKSRSKDKVKEKSKTGSGDECQQMESSAAHKRTNSGASSNKQKRKKRKRSKDRNDGNIGRDRDRELVDRLFAEAVTQQQNLHDVYNDGDDNIPCSSKSKDKNISKSSDRDRHKRKKKKKSHSRGSASPSILPAYKKHHSGHKRSSDKHNQDSERRRHQHRRSRESATSENPAGASSLERELRVPRNQPLSPTSVGHSVTSTFQTSYLARSDTVSHIPLNVWVSTWPSIPVSHTFPPPPASSSFPLPSVSQPFASSSLPSYSLNHSSSERNSSAVDSQTISSESESSTDSNTDDSPDKSVSSLPNRARTKQWVDVNFSGMGRRATTGSSQMESTVPQVTRNWGLENLNESNKASTGPSDSVADVVSIASGDEDVVVCSSASSAKSESDEIRVIESCDITGDGVAVNDKNSGAASSVVSHAVKDDVGKCSTSSLEQDKGATGSGSFSKTTSPLASVSFQPFKLSRKSALTKHVNPFLSSVAQNSGDEETVDAETSQSCQEETKSVDVPASSSQDTVKNSSSVSESKTAKTSIAGQENRDDCYSNIYPLVPSGVFESSLNAAPNIPMPLSGSSHVYPMLAGEQNMLPSTSFTLPGSSTDTVFGVLPPLQVPTTVPVSSVLSSSLSYLPYTPLSVSTSLSSILPQSMPFVVPQAPASPTLPLHFPFPPLQPLLPGSSSLFPTVYPGYSQTTQVATKPSGAPVTDSVPKTSFSLLVTGDNLDVQNEKAECSTQDADDREEASAARNLECAQDIFPQEFTEGTKSALPAVDSCTKENPAFNARLLIDEQSEEQLQSSCTQDWAGTDKSVVGCVDLLEVESSSNICQSACETISSTAEGDVRLISDAHGPLGNVGSDTGNGQKLVSNVPKSVWDEAIDVQAIEESCSAPVLAVQNSGDCW